MEQCIKESIFTQRFVTARCLHKVAYVHKAAQK